MPPLFHLSYSWQDWDGALIKDSQPLLDQESMVQPDLKGKMELKGFSSR